MSANFNSLLFFLFFSVFCSAQNNDAKQIIANSIKYHDPDSKLMTGDYTFKFDESRPDGKTNKSYIQMAPSKEKFKLMFFRDNDIFEYNINKSEVSIVVNGESEYNDELKKKYKISTDRASRLKDYYLYLWHLPMKLNDPGTIISPHVNTTKFNNKMCYEIKVTYDENVGKDIWYFYFDTDTYALTAYRFYHDESANDGEYIFLEEEFSSDNIRLPANRKWFTHKEDKFLGEDKLVALVKNK